MNDQKNNMATASLVMGILSLVLLCCYGGLLFGGLGILFAILSRTGDRLSGQAQAGLILSVIALTISILFFAGLSLFLLMGSGGSSPIQNLPAFPQTPELTLPDNELWNLPVWTGGGLV